MTPHDPPPDYDGRSLVNLIAELEHRLTGSSQAPKLAADMAAVIPHGNTYVLVLMDGLGAAQLGHPEARSLKEAHRETISAPFPSTTTVSLASVATGLPPRRHGMLGHMMFLPEHGVFNALKWIDRHGRRVDRDMSQFLPAPNLWERLTANGVEPITIQPGHFTDTPLTKALYRGCRFEAVWSHEELVSATVALAQEPGRLIFVYLADVDFAAHLYGQRSADYAAAMRTVASFWESVCQRLDGSIVLIGTADHGHIDYAPDAKVLIPSETLAGIDVFGDPRALMLRGDRAESVAQQLPGRWVPLVEARSWWGPGPEHPDFAARTPDGIILAEPDSLLIPGHMDRRLVGYHGGLALDEINIPLLVS